MKTETTEWIVKAEGDWATAGREAAITDNPNHDAVCFHCQQCAEKYLKARLIEDGITFPKSHDLAALLELLLSKRSDLEALRAPLARLTEFAVGYRYPGVSSTEELAREAVEDCRTVRDALRIGLGLG
ncbi:MAG: HEPN domain-containing protein [Verrucomicrobia bacterium]|nr:HEPN domain-containing protein [Verrucomicrobiota bacterium]